MKQYRDKKFRDMEFGLLVAFKLNKKLSVAQKSAFLRKIRGYVDHSQYGRYRYRRLGVLAKMGIPYYSPMRGLLVIKERDFSRIKRFFSGKVEVYVWRVILTRQDIKRMEMVVKSGR